MTRRETPAIVRCMVDPSAPEADPSGPGQPPDAPAPAAAAAVVEPPKPARSRARSLLVIGGLFLSSCCGFLAFRACGVSPGSAAQTEARGVAQQYLDAVSAHDWARVYELSDPALQSAQSLEAQQSLFLAHPDLFDFDAVSFEGFQYSASMTGGDRLRLTGRLTGQSSARRTFRMDMQQQDDGGWRVRGFHVELEFGPEPSAG